MNHPKLGHFELLEQIGKGGMATVFLAYDPSLDRKVAIKLLDEDLAHQDQQFVESFIREARITAGINHPNIVQIYFVGEEDGNYYIAMELLEGRSLHEIIKKEGPLDESRALWIMFQVVDALQTAYEKQMIHGDIKPMNIFITDTGTTKLVDFGLAKMANIETSEDSKRAVWGSAYYISPERVGRKAEDFRSDIYSLGATMFHVLVGHPPFDAETSEKLAQKRLNEKAPDVHLLNPAISEKTSAIIGRMLNKSIFLRYLDYEALLADLRSVQIEGGEGRNSSITVPGQGMLLVQMRESLLKIKSKLSHTAEIIKLVNPVEAEESTPASQPLRLVHPIETRKFATTTEHRKQVTLVEQRKLATAGEPQKHEAFMELPDVTMAMNFQTDQLESAVVTEETEALTGETSPEVIESVQPEIAQPAVKTAGKRLWPIIFGIIIILGLAGIWLFLNQKNLGWLQKLIGH